MTGLLLISLACGRADAIHDGEVQSRFTAMVDEANTLRESGDYDSARLKLNQAEAVLPEYKADHFRESGEVIVDSHRYIIDMASGDVQP